MKLTKKQKEELRIMEKDYCTTIDDSGLLSKCGNWRWMGYGYERCVELDGHKYEAHVIWWGQVFFFEDKVCLLNTVFHVGQMKDQLDNFNMFFDKLINA